MEMRGRSIEETSPTQIKKPDLNWVDGANLMEDSHGALPWKEITFFLLTIGILLLCALLLRPFFSAIAGAVILAVVTQRPYDWLATKIKNRFVCAAAGRPRHSRRYCSHFLPRARDRRTSLCHDKRLPCRSPPGIRLPVLLPTGHLSLPVSRFSQFYYVTNAARSTAAYLGGNFAGFVGQVA